MRTHVESSANVMGKNFVMDLIYHHGGTTKRKTDSLEMASRESRCERIEECFHEEISELHSSIEHLLATLVLPDSIRASIDGIVSA